MKTKNVEELQKEIDLLKEKNSQLQAEMDQIQVQDKTIYRQVNSLLLWKSALKVRVNVACPNKDLVGKEGYLCDLFLDGWTVVVYGDPSNPANWTANNFYRLDADYLDVVEWDTAQFQAAMKHLGYLQHEGKWIHKDQLVVIKPK